jgi:hypothetical protein
VAIFFFGLRRPFRISWLIVVMGSPSSHTISNTSGALNPATIKLVFIFLPIQVVKAIFAHIEKLITNPDFNVSVGL